MQSFEWYIATVPVKYQQYHFNIVDRPFSKISEKSKKNFRVIFNTIGIDLLSESDKIALFG